MLVDIQITVLSITLEHKQLKKELADLKTYIQMKDKELSELKILVDKTAKSNDALEKKLQAYRYKKYKYLFDWNVCIFRSFFFLNTLHSGFPLAS